jgi:hypothetical protein
VAWYRNHLEQRVHGVTPRAAQLHLDREAVARRHRRHRGHVPLPWRCRRGVALPFDREDDVVCGNEAAIVPAHVVAQLKQQRGIALEPPRAREIGRVVAERGIAPCQCAKHQMDSLIGRIAAERERVQLVRLAVGQHDQHAAGRAAAERAVIAGRRGAIRVTVARVPARQDESGQKDRGADSEAEFEHGWSGVQVQNRSNVHGSGSASAASS